MSKALCLWFRDNTELTIADAVQQWREIAQNSIQQRGSFKVALSGGRTPIVFYEALTNAIESKIWHNTHIFMVDERCVPSDAAESNFALIRQSFLLKSIVTAGQIHWPQISSGNLSQDIAEAYEQALQKFFGSQPVQFDLIILGMGEDGHTASLFPEDSALNVNNQWVVAVAQQGNRCARISLTLPAIHQSKNIFFLCFGRSKAEIMSKMLSGKGNLPAQKVCTGLNLVWMFTDEAAMGRLI